MKKLILVLLFISCATTENQTPVEPVKNKVPIQNVEKPMEQRFTNDLGKMNWKDADDKCRKLGMRLPTLNEFTYGNDPGEFRNNIQTYWTAKENMFGAYQPSTFRPGSTMMQLQNMNELFEVRCFKGHLKDNKSIGNIDRRSETTIEQPQYEIMDVCPNLGNLKEIPENKIHLVNGIKQINVKYRDSNKTELVPLDVAQNSINTLDTKDKYVDFKKYYSKFCYTYIPFAGQTKFSQDLAIKIKQLKEKNKKLIEEKNKKDQEVEKLESQISELQKDLPKKKSAPTNTFLLTGEPNTKTEDEIFVYGLAVSQNNNAFEKGAILQKEFYVVNRKGLELPYGVFYVEGMLFIGEVKRETKNGRVVVLNYYSKTPIEEKLSKEDTQKVKVLNEKIKKLELKREKIQSELDEIIVKLQPLIIAEYEYSEVSDVTKSQIVKPSTTTGSVNTQSVTWSEFQGIMNWKDAKKKCSSIGMQLPTIEELNAAYAAKVTESWKTDGYLYWSSTNVSDDSAYVLGTLSGSNDPVNHSVNRYVRCWSLNR